MSEDIHVMPVNDLREHESAADCWCRPRRDEEEPRVLIHNSMDERESYEQGRKFQ
jgi:hypothetical protein